MEQSTNGLSTWFFLLNCVVECKCHKDMMCWRWLEFFNALNSFLTKGNHTMLRKKKCWNFEFACRPEKHTANQSDPLFGATFIFSEMIQHYVKWRLWDSTSIQPKDMTKQQATETFLLQPLRNLCHLEIYANDGHFLYFHFIFFFGGGGGGVFQILETERSGIRSKSMLRIQG